MAAIDLSKTKIPAGAVMIKEEIFPVVPVGKRVRCPKCNIGYMLFDMAAMSSQVVLLSQPPLFPHRCDKCGHAECYPKQYPTVEFEALTDVNPNDQSNQEEEVEHGNECGETTDT